MPETNPRELVERLRERAEQIGMPGGLSHDLHVEAASEITRLRGLLEEAREVLGPFTTVAQFVDEEGWTANTHKERISYWFGPSDFRAASSLLKRLEDATSTPSGQ